MSFLNKLNPLSSFLGFATSASSPQQGVKITQDPSSNVPGAWKYHPAPPPSLGQGEEDEGAWPRMVLFDNALTLLSRNEWKILKTSASYECFITSPSGFPVASLKAGATAPTADNPIAKETQAMNDKSTPARLSSHMSVDTITPGNAGSQGAHFQSFSSYMSVDTIMPATSQGPSVQPLQSFMSIDTVAPADRMSFMWTNRNPPPTQQDSFLSAVSDATVRAPPKKTLCTHLLLSVGIHVIYVLQARTGSATLFTKANGRKRANHHQHQLRVEQLSPEPKRPRPSTSKSPGPMSPPLVRPRRESAREKRYRERRVYEKRRRELKDEIRMLEMLNEAAHEIKINKMRQRLKEIEEIERRARELEREREEERKVRVRLHNEARFHPRTVSGSGALERFVDQFQALLARRNADDAGRINIDAIPFPVLLDQPHSLTLVTTEEVAKFFAAVKPFVQRKRDYALLFKKIRVEFHPDRWAHPAKRCKASEGCEPEIEIVQKAMNEVMMWVNPNLGNWLASL